MADVPPGSYQMHVWHSSLAETDAAAAVPLTVGAADVEQRVRLGAGRTRQVSHAERRWRGSLAARIALVFLVLLLAVQLASFAALRLSLSHHAAQRAARRA